MQSSNGASAAVEVPISELRHLCDSALRTLGYEDEEVTILSDVMLYAQLRGNNQGVIKITSGGLDRAGDERPLALDKETPVSALIDGGNRPGMLVLRRATELAASKARAHGVGVVGTHHTATSTGALGYYAEALAAQGLIGVVLAQSPEYVAPHGAKQPIFGTNPIALAVPVPGGAPPVVLDMATAAYAWFGLLEARTAGRPIPGDVAQDAEGRPTTDPSAVLQGGAVRVFDRSHKGSGLALMVELLAGALVGAAVEGKRSARNWGNLVVALDPALLGDREDIGRRVEQVLARVKGADRLPGVEEILLPGERGARLAAARTSAAALPVEPNLLAALRDMAARAPPPAPPRAASPAPSRPASPAFNGAANGALFADGNGTASPQPSELGGPDSWALPTRLLHPEAGSVVDVFDASGAPLYQTATFGQPGATEMGPFDYTRSGNPTRTQFEEQWAAVEGADRALSFTSGMAALAAVTRLVPAGGHIVAGDDLYGGTSRLLSQVVPNYGVSVTHVDMTDLAAVQAAITPGHTKLVMVESPTNPRMQVCDIAAIAAAARAAGALVCVDNSFMTPLWQRPLDLGAHISMTSGTKYIGGHGDVTLGVLAVRGEDLARRLYFVQNAEGAGLAPFDCWLAQRGLKTMALRMERQAASAARLAAYLAAHPLVRRLNWAGWPAHPGSELHARQASAGGAVLSFETGSLEASKVVVDATRLFKITVSFGSVVSLISLPCYMSHASIPAEVRAARGLPDDLVRISVGVEDPEDLIADLDQALKRAMDAIGFTPPAAVDGGAGNGAGAGEGAREAALLARIRELESALAAARGQQQHPQPQQQQQQQQQPTVYRF